MKTRYCLESAGPEGRTSIIHEQGCTAYDLASLLSEGLVSDVGLHADVAGALASVRTKLHDLASCPYCCPVLRPVSGRLWSGQGDVPI